MQELLMTGEYIRQLHLLFIPNTVYYKKGITVSQNQM